MQHFPLLKKLVNSETDLCSEKIKVCVEILDAVSTNFAAKFSDLENRNPTCAFLVNPFVFDAV